MQELNKVKGYRTMAGITQAEMAKQIGVSERTYATKEQDVKKFTISELDSLVKVLNKHNLNIKLSDLF